MKSECGAYRMTEEERQRAQAREENYIHTVASERRHELLFAPYGVSFSVFRVLSFLMLHPEGAAPSQIADELLILRQTMTNVVDAMEQRGLVARAADPRDRRRIRVELRPEGWKLGKTLLQMEEEYSRRLGRHLTQEELEMHQMLEKKLYQAKEIELERILAERNQME